ncbi:DUF4381 domain-containing protein [Myxococcota bacterium]|nr:DUF4381 domain-containing protein [Myxococcota bacterium]
MNAAPDPLLELRDIHLPEAIASWPLAPGWWVLWVGLIGLAALSLWGVRRRRASVRRAALMELDALEAGYQHEGDAVVLAHRLSSLLRRVALVRFDRNTVAALHGQAWARFLESSVNKKRFPAELVCTLEQAVYAGPSIHHEPDDVAAWISACRGWIRRVS